MLCIGFFVLNFGGGFFDKIWNSETVVLDGKFSHVTYVFLVLCNTSSVKLFCVIKQIASSGVWQCKNGINKY